MWLKGKDCLWGEWENKKVFTLIAEVPSLGWSKSRIWLSLWPNIDLSVKLHPEAPGGAIPATLKLDTQVSFMPEKHLSKAR